VLNVEDEFILVVFRDIQMNTSFPQEYQLKQNNSKTRRGSQREYLKLQGYLENLSFNKFFGLWHENCYLSKMSLQTHATRKRVK